MTVDVFSIEEALKGTPKDLVTLSKVRTIEAWEGVIFYAARIFEHVFLQYSEERLGEKETNLFAALCNVEPFNLFPISFLYFSNSLRRLGNTVRHSTAARITKAEAETAIRLLVILLRHMEKLRSDAPEHPESRLCLALFADLLDGDQFEVYELLQQPQVDHRKMWNLWSARTEIGLFRSPTQVALYAEILINDRKFEAQDLLVRARQVLETAFTELAGEDLSRLHQLYGLLLKKLGEEERAIIVLTRDCKKDDPETVGILASSYRTKWLQTKERRWLEKAVSMYEKNYERSGSFYIGINLAATALYLGKHERSRRVAGEIVDNLTRRLHKYGFSVQHLSDWDLATLAEALLLCGRFQEAKTRYREYFDRVGHAQGMTDSTYQQLQRNLRHLGMTCTSEEFLARLAPMGSALLRVGVSGHRTLPNAGEIEAQLSEVHARLRARHPERRLCVVTPLAEGADRFVARVFTELGGAERPGIVVELPLEIDDYAKDFQEEASRAEFFEWLTWADEVRFPTPQPTRDDAYLDVGRRVLEHSDIMIFLWDGQPARGKGGTAEVVELARAQGKPFDIITVRR